MLGVSSATLRRLARGYEAAFEELPTDGAGGRLYPDHALNLMSEARALVKTRQIGTLELAFKRLADGDDLATPVTSEPTPGLEAVVAELVAIRQAMERQAEEIRELKVARPTFPFGERPDRPCGRTGAS